MQGAPHFVLFGTPVRVEPTFFLVAAYLALAQQEVGLMIAWVVVMFVGILLHELGHALAYRYYGSGSAIVLWGFGGLTYGSAGLTPGRHVVVSLAGPLSGLVLLGLPAWWLQRSGVVTDPTVADVLDMVVWVNVLWSVVNLLPMLPLDGGNIARDLITVVTGRPGERPARLISIVTAVVAGAAAFLVWGLVIAPLMALAIAAMNVTALRRAGPGGSSFIRVEHPGGRPAGLAGRRPAARPTARAATARGATARPAPSAVSPAQHLGRGFAALEQGDPAAALDAADRILTGESFPDVHRQALELRAWALLRSGRADEAAATAASLPGGRKASRFLRAALGATGPAGDRPEQWAGDLVDAFLFAPAGPEKVQASLFLAESELADDVGGRLVAAGPAGRAEAEVLRQTLGSRGFAGAAAAVGRHLAGA